MRGAGRHSLTELYGRRSCLRDFVGEHRTTSKNTPKNTGRLQKNVIRGKLEGSEIDPIEGRETKGEH